MKIILTVLISILATFTYFALFAGLIAMLFGVSFHSVTTFPLFIAISVMLGIPAGICTADAVYQELEKQGV